MRKKFTMLLALLLACMGVVKAQPEVGKEYRIKVDAQNLYLTIRSYNGEGHTAAYGTVPLLTKEEANVNQVWTLEESGTENVYYLRSKSGYYLRHSAYNINAHNDDGAKAKVQFYADGDTYKIKNIDATQWWKSQAVASDDGTWHPFCNAAENAAATWVLEEVPANEFGDVLFSTDNYKFYYNIKNLRVNKYANFDGAGTFSETSVLNAGSYWYFVDATVKLPKGTEVPDGFIACYIYNAANGKAVQNHGNGHMSAVDDGTYPAKIYYIRAHAKDGLEGYAIHYYENEGSAWNDYGGGSVTTFSYDDKGSIWDILPAELTKSLAVGYADASKRAAATLFAAAKEASYYTYSAETIATAEEEVNALNTDNIFNALSGSIAAEVALNNSEKVGAPAAGDIIMLKNKNVNKYLIDNGENARIETANKENKALWYVVAGENGVKLKNYATGRYLGSMVQSVATVTVEAETDAAEYTWTNPQGVYAAFNFVGSNQYGHESWSNLVGWWDNAANASQWVVTNVRPLSITYLYKDKELSTSTEYVKYGTVYTVTSPYAFTKPIACKKGEEALETVDGVFSFELTETTTLTVELGDDLPFIPAADYASIKNWYYIQMHSSSGYEKYIQAMDGYIEWADANINANEIDSYTWGFVGNPFDGFMLVNYGAGETMAVNSNGEGNPALGNIGTGTKWAIKASATNKDAEHFCFQYPGSNNYMNAQEGKIAFWTSADQGSTMWVTERDLSGATELKALIESAGALVTALSNSTGVGSVTSESLSALNSEIVKAQAAANAKEGCIEAQASLQEAIDALETIQPEEGVFYTLKNNYTDRYMNVNADAGLVATTAVGIGEVFQFVKDNGSLYLKNVERGAYLNTAVQHGSGQNAASATTIAGAKAVVVKNLGKGNQVSITPNGGATLHHDTNNNSVVAWNAGVDSKSSWSIEAVDIAALSHVVSISDVKWASLVLGFNATIPAGVTAYIVSEVTNNSATLEEVTGVLPANTAVLINAEAGDYGFKYASEAGSVEGNLLSGTVFNTNVTEDAYILANGDKGLGLYKAKKEISTDTTNDGTEEAPAVTYEAFKNNANKAYLLASAVANANAPMFSLNRGEGTTSIDELSTVSEQQTTVIYDLTGRRVEKMEKGIYIVNGRKVVIK